MGGGGIGDVPQSVRHSVEGLCRSELQLCCSLCSSLTT
jgi:hypothetical protein